jgi:hypothetical protein
MKDDEVVAHYAHTGDGSAAVIRIGQLAERVVVAAATTMHPTNYRTTPAASERGLESHNAVARRVMHIFIVQPGLMAFGRECGEIASLSRRSTCLDTTGWRTVGGVEHMEWSLGREGRSAILSSLCR